MSSLHKQFQPTVTSPYRKLLQIGGGILLLVILLNQLIVNLMDNQEALDEHFEMISDSYIQQSINTGKLLLQRKDKKQVRAFVKSLSVTELVKGATLYDKSGQIIAQSDNRLSIKELYGIEQGSVNVAPDTLSIVREIRDGKLIGFIRLTLNKKQFTQKLESQLKEQSEIARLMMLMAIISGFLLTRGFGRFSRQGVRLIKTSELNKRAKN